MVKINIQEDGNERIEYEGDIVYGCVANKTGKDPDGNPADGTFCRGFLIGGIGYPNIVMAEPMTDNMILITEQVAAGDKNLEMAMLKIEINRIIARLQSIETEGKEDKNGGN